MFRGDASQPAPADPNPHRSQPPWLSPATPAAIGVSNCLLHDHKACPSHNDCGTKARGLAPIIQPRRPRGAPAQNPRTTGGSRVARRRNGRRLGITYLFRAQIVELQRQGDAEEWQHHGEGHANQHVHDPEGPADHQ